MVIIMKINIKSLLLILIFIICLTGCTDSKNNINKNQNNFSINSKTAYINIWNEFRTLSGEFIPEGKAFKKSIKDDNYDILSKLSLLRTLYFNNGKFTQFSFRRI